MTGIIIQARMGSTRLPGKITKIIEGRTILEHVIDRCREVKNSDKVILATTQKREDDVLEEIAKKNNIEVFRGSEDDVLDRYYQTAKLFGIEVIVRITGDCPLLDPEITEQVIDFYLKGNYDYASNTDPPTFPDGYDVEVCSFSALKKTWENAELNSEREHVFPYIRKNRTFFKTGNLTNKEDLSNLRLTLDEEKDLILIKEIFQELYNKNKFFGLKEIIELFGKKPELIKINQSIKRNEGYLKSLREDEEKNKMKKGIELWNKAKKIIPGGTQLLSKRSEMFLPEQWPSYFKKAKGVKVWDLDGNKYIDMSAMGLGSCILGYADPDVNRAVEKVITRGSMSTLNSPEETELAELLLKIHPWAEMARFARTGGEAVAVAVRIARAYSNKEKLAFCGYHGWSDWYLAANLADDKNLDGHLLPGLETRGVPRGLRGTAIPFHYNKIEELEDIVSKNEDIGVIVMEPMRHQEPENNFLKKVKEISNKIGAVLIFDEVSSGWRFNIGGIHLKYGVNPDIAVFAKGMSNGFPMAAIIGKKDVMEAAQETFISSTYWTERIGPAAAIATIKKIIEKKVPTHLEKMGKMLIKGLKQSADNRGLKIKITGLPALINFSFDYGENSQAIRTLFTQEMLKRGILAFQGIYLSYGHKEEHIKKYLEKADEVFSLISKAIENNEIEDLLNGPVAHTGFRRLT